ncbi:hypothetical protein CRENBAI_013297 [Crenichthys baileyi]|uniref:Uncharacterized protein n=1 Tax=Crenichthys baileyi TaxID=28760 RepID=A0AAV9RAU2_9TELE
MALKCLIKKKITFAMIMSVGPVFSPVQTHKADVSVAAASPPAGLAFDVPLQSGWLWRSHQLKWSIPRHIKSTDLDLQSSPIALLDPHSHKAKLPSGMSPGSFGAPKTAGIFPPHLQPVENICLGFEADFEVTMCIPDGCLSSGD